MNTAVKSHFRASNNAAIKTREVRQKISSQWGSLDVQEYITHMSCRLAHESYELEQR